MKHVLAGLLLCIVAIHLSVSEPPGGFYSSCCPYRTVHECDRRHVEVDSRFSKQSCRSSESITGIPCETRRYFMQKALDRLLEVSGSPCPFNPFYALIVNHTGPNIEDGLILCEGLSDPVGLGATWHGEMVAFNVCDALIRDQFGPGPGGVFNPQIWQRLSLYTTGEPCTMCMNTGRWHRLGEFVYSIGNKELDDEEWFQVTDIDNEEIQFQSNRCLWGSTSLGTSYQTRLIKGVLDNKIRPYFTWQFDPDALCPQGCLRDSSGSCVAAP